VVLYGCQTWSLIVREEQTEGVLEQDDERDILTEER
jgi:hypothetical protein